MKIYRISYHFDGNGYVDIKAKDAQTAEELWREGEFDNEKEWGEDYVIDNIELKK